MMRIKNTCVGVGLTSSALKQVTEKSHLSRMSAVLLLILAACNAANSSETSLYTSVKSGDCRKPSATLSAYYESRGLTAEECDGAKGWRLFAVSSDERSWLELARDTSLWSSEEQVVHKNDFGNFPNLGAEKEIGRAHV